MYAEIIIKNNDGKVMQSMMVDAHSRAETSYPVPLVDGETAVGGFVFEFKDVHKLEK